MLAKIICCALVIIIHAVAIFLGFGTMLLAMNGYNDRAAEAAIPAYIISQIIFVVISAVCVFLFCWLFQNKLQWNVFLSGTLAIVISLILVGILTMVAIGIGIGFGDMAFRGRI